MYRPPFRQDRPHIATGVTEDKPVWMVEMGLATKACAPLALKPTVSRIA